MDTLSDEILIHIFAQGTAKEIVKKEKDGERIIVTLFLCFSHCGGGFHVIGMF